MLPAVFYKTAANIRCAIKANTHATTHCHTTTPSDHLTPSSRRIAAIAATQGVYRSENTRRDTAEAAGIMPATFSPNSICIVDTTLSFAINPLMSDVVMRQSPSPRGFMIGEIQPATIASMT